MPNAGLDKAIYAHGIFNQLEGPFGDTSSFRWSGKAWVGTDEDKIWLRIEGRLSNNEMDDGIRELFYGRVISTYFNAMAGVHYGPDSLPSRGWVRSTSKALLLNSFGLTGYVIGMKCAAEVRATEFEGSLIHVKRSGTQLH